MNRLRPCGYSCPHDPNEGGGQPVVEHRLCLIAGEESTTHCAGETNRRRVLSCIEGISAGQQWGKHDMPRAVRLYARWGLRDCNWGERGRHSQLSEQGRDISNLIAQHARAVDGPVWGVNNLYVAMMLMHLYDLALAAAVPPRQNPVMPNGVRTSSQLIDPRRPRNQFR